MIPVLAVPVLDRYDLLEGMEKSIDVEVRRYYIIDNGGRYAHFTGGWYEDRHVCRPGANLGFGASINLAIKANLAAPWWFFANDDMIFKPGHLAKLAEFMWGRRSTPQLAFLENCGFGAFAVNDLAVERVGWFDESYHPAYCEDCDWEWRARRVGDVEITDIEGGSIHLASQTIADPGRKKQNDRTYFLNKDYHRAKWGGEPRREEFATPFNEGGDPSVTMAPKLSRLRDLAW